MVSAIAATWISFTLIGQWSLLFLLGTFYVVKSLPQRSNTFLINFLLTMFLATIPPLLLFLTGQQDLITVPWICFVQSVLMDGVAPMFGTALTILTIQLWLELRAMVKGKPEALGIFERHFYLKCLLLLTPYLVCASWCIASLTGSLAPSADVKLLPFVFCTNQSAVIPVRKQIGYFMIACTIISIVFEIWTVCLVKRSVCYRANGHQAVRLLIFSLLQLSPIILTALAKLGPYNSFSHRRATTNIENAIQVIEAMDALATFLVFGTQRSVLQAWHILSPPAIQNEHV
ncbi:hypothetical protein K439DRAFT_747156 [Ramaria rubella]|nr:hypothetical protein K439DRAFT_747156 [Ramaria rubella]